MISDRKRKILALVVLACLLLAAAYVAAAHRQDLADAYRRFRQGPLPPALTAAQVRERSAALPDVTTPEASPTEPATAVGAEPTPAVEGEPIIVTPDEMDRLPTPPSDRPAAPAADSQPPLPAAMNLKVPMVYQAPLNNWDATHEETCEEAAMLMIRSFVRGEAAMSREEMDRQLLDMVAYENKTLGYFKDTDAATTAGIMRDYLGLTGAEVLPVTSVEDIKRQIAAGRPVILPADGRALKNPNFRNGGPPYHMIVAKGYTATGDIITNDPGTRKGADYIYDPDVLFAAIHDWNNGDVPNGAKVMIVVK